jgi:hypothetical protein
MTRMRGAVVFVSLEEVEEKDKKILDRRTWE